MYSEENLQAIKECCMYPRGKRPGNVILTLSTLTMSLKIFSQLSASQGHSTLQHLCQYFSYESYLSDSSIFKYGEPGTKYYIVLDGAVSIKIPEKDLTTYTEIMLLHPGAAFGEIALETSKPRGASASCVRDSQFLVLNKKDYLKYLQRTVSASKQDLISFLQVMPVFRNISKMALTKLTYSITERSYNKEQPVFRENDQSGNIYIVREGECAVCQNLIRQNRSFGIRKVAKSGVFTAKKVGPGTMMGEEDYISGRPHSYSLICKSDKVVMCIITGKEFFCRISAEEIMDFLQEQAENKSKYLEDWKNIRNSLEGIFDKEIVQEAKTERKVQEYKKRVKVFCRSPVKVLEKSRNLSRTRLEVYARNLDLRSKSKLTDQSIHSHHKVGISLVSMNSLPIFEGLWTKKLEIRGGSHKRKIIN